MFRKMFELLAQLIPRRSQSADDPYKDEFKYGIWKPGATEKMVREVPERARGLGLKND